MEKKLEQPNTSARSAAEIEKEGREQHTGEHMNENTLMSNRKYRDLESEYHSVKEITEDFEIRKMIDRQARHMRGDYIVNTRMERYMQPGSHPESDPNERSKNFPRPGNIEDQHLIRPAVRRIRQD